MNHYDFTDRDHEVDLDLQGRDDDLLRLEQQLLGLTGSIEGHELSVDWSNFRVTTHDDHLERVRLKYLAHVGAGTVVHGPYPVLRPRELELLWA